MSFFLPLFSIVTGVFSGITQLGGYVLYVKKINLGRVKPNTASWAIWAFGSLLESVTYIYTTNDWVKNILPVICALSAIALFVYCAHFGHFQKPSIFDFFLVCLDCVAIFLWWYYSSASYANLALVVTAIISFIPITIGVWDNPKSEHALPWFVWTIAYSMLTVVVLTRWEKWEDLIYPLVFAILHFIVAVLSVDKRDFISV